MKNDEGEMSMCEDLKQKAWLEHHQRLLNVEFDWDSDHVSNEPPVDMVKRVFSQVKADKAPGPSDIVVEII